MKRLCVLSRIIGIVLFCALVFTGCGTGSADQHSAPVTNGQDGQMDNASGPDSPVSGQPGQPGNQVNGNMVQGRVTDATGQPLAQVSVTPQSTDTPPQAVPEIAVLTDDQGQYQWTLPPGTYTLTFVHEGYAPLTKAVVVQNQPTMLDVTLERE